MNGTALRHAPAADPSEDGLDRRGEAREPVIGHVWLLDHRSATALRCRCVDVSRHGLRLHAPLGYGIAPGRSYELCSQMPGQSPPPGMSMIISRRGRVVRARVTVGAGDRDDALELGIELEDGRLTVPVCDRATAESSGRA